MSNSNIGIKGNEAFAPGASSSYWPSYCYEWEDLLAQQQQGELERTQQQQNRIRLLPSLRAISEMEQAICWPAQYLGRLPDLIRAVNAVALAHSLDRDAGRVAVSVAAMAIPGGSATTPAARSSRKAYALAGRRCSRALTHKSGIREQLT